MWFQQIYKVDLNTVRQCDNRGPRGELWFSVFFRAFRILQNIAPCVMPN